MSLFTSGREARLWAWTLAVVVAIYSTLGLTGKLVGVLPDDDQQAVFFLAGMFLVGTTVVTQGLRIRPRGTEMAVALGIAAVYLMLFLRITLAERSHLIEYGVLAVFVHEALVERARNGRRVPAPALVAVLGTALVGVVDEGIQLALPSRVFDPADILFNVLAAAGAVAAAVLLARARRWRLEKRDPPV